MLPTRNHTSVTYHVFVVEVEGIKCLPHTDTVMGSSYTSLNLTNKFKINPIQKQHKRTEKLLHSIVKKAVIYKFGIRDINRSFKLNLEVNKVEK